MLINITRNRLANQRDNALMAGNPGPDIGCADGKQGHLQGAKT